MAVTSDRHICRRVKLNGEVEEVEGTIKAEYDFDKKWELKDMEDENDFSSKEKADKALNVTLLWRFSLRYVKFWLIKIRNAGICLLNKG